MALALDGSVLSAISLTGTETTSLTVGNNANRILLVEYATYQGAGPSGITYNGVSLTKIVERVGSFNEQCSIWGLIAPDTGTHDVVISGAGSWSAFGILSIYGADQTLPSNTNTGGGDSTTASLSLTSLVDNSWIVGVIESEPDPTMTTTSGVLDWDIEGASYQHGSGQHVVKATAGSHTISSSLSYGARWNIALLELKEAATSTTSTSTTSTSSSTSTSSTSSSTSRTTSTSTTSTSTSVTTSTSTTSTSTSKTTSTSTTSTSSSTSTTSTSSSTTLTTSTSTTSTSTTTTVSMTTSTSTTSTSSSTSTSTTTTLAGSCTEVLDQSQTGGVTSAGFGEVSATRYRGQAWVPTYSRLEAISFQLGSVGTQGIKVYIDSATGSIPDHSPGAEIYSFTIANATLAASFKKYLLPVPLDGLTPGAQYAFYLAPWNIAGNTYSDDYRDLTWINSNAYLPGDAIVNNAGTWSVSDTGNLDMKFETYACSDSGTTTSSSTSSSTSTSTTSTSSSTSKTTSTSTTSTSTSITQSVTTSTSTTQTQSITTSTSISTSSSTTITVPYSFEIVKQEQNIMERKGANFSI